MRVGPSDSLVFMLPEASRTITTLRPVSASAGASVVAMPARPRVVAMVMAAILLLLDALRRATVIANLLLEGIPGWHTEGASTSVAAVAAGVHGQAKRGANLLRRVIREFSLLGGLFAALP